MIKGSISGRERCLKKHLNEKKIVYICSRNGEEVNYEDIENAAECLINKIEFSPDFERNKLIFSIVRYILCIY